MLGYDAFVKQLADFLFTFFAGGTLYRRYTPQNIDSFVYQTSLAGGRPVQSFMVALPVILVCKSVSAC